MKNSSRKQISFRETLLLHARGIKELGKILPQLLPSLGCQAAAAALTPYVLIFFSARILNELSVARRPEEIWRWVIWTIAAGGMLSVLNALLTAWKNVQTALWWTVYETPFSRKMFSMDYADMDNPSTHERYAQIDQNLHWGGRGLSRLIDIVPGTVQALVGMISAAALTVGLFASPVPKEAGWLCCLNHPLFIPVLPALMLILSSLSGKLSSHYEKAFNRLTSAATLGNKLFSYFEALTGDDRRAADIRMYDQGGIILHYFEESRNRSFGIRGPFAAYSRGAGGLCRGVSVALPAVFTGFVYVFTCLKALAGAFGIGSVTQYVGAVTGFSRNLTTLFTTAGRMRGNATSLKQTFDFLDIPNSMYMGTIPTEKRMDREYDIEFRNVSFKYPGSDAWALRHVSVRFRAGRRYAAVGENGSGKTTFIKLLCRLYDPQEGEILLNGINIKKYSYQEYMDLFSVVFQDFQLLSQPLGSNVAGSGKYDAARVRQALEDAGFGERLASLPEGLGTQLYRDWGENGIELSGGEAQKIAIARALYRNAPFLILDEPTAALDPIAEAEIYEQLDRIVDDRTAVYISHRLSSCRFCDEILVFDHGQIVQRGGHEELLREENGKYAQLWHAQAKYYRESDKEES